LVTVCPCLCARVLSTAGPVCRTPVRSSPVLCCRSQAFIYTLSSRSVATRSLTSGPGTQGPGTAVVSHAATVIVEQSAEAMAASVLPQPPPARRGLRHVRGLAVSSWKISSDAGEKDAAMACSCCQAAVVRTSLREVQVLRKDRAEDEKAVSIEA
jgi:hypothetical protein